MDRLTRTVREQVALGRLLPLGGPDDAAWITERTTVRALRRACAALPGVRLGEVDVTLDLRSPGPGPSAAVPDAAPLGALPHLPVRIDAAFEAAPDEPLPLAADRLRDALWDTAQDLLGIAVAAVDLRVTGLLAGEAAAAPEDPEDTEDAEDADHPDAEVAEASPSAAVEAAVRAVPGVLGLTRRLAGLGSGLRVHDTTTPPDTPARRVQVQIAVAPGHAPLHTARAVATAVSTAAAKGAPGPVTTAVVVTDV